MAGQEEGEQKEEAEKGTGQEEELGPKEVYAVVDKTKVSSIKRKCSNCWIIFAYVTLLEDVT